MVRNAKMFLSKTILTKYKINPMKKAIKLLFLLLTAKSYSQTLHHQMMSAQGGSATSESGVIVKYTIGQQSVTGIKTGSVMVQQGFQQNNWEKIIAPNNVVLVNTMTYPNPYLDFINFQFSQSIGDKVVVLVYDVLGRQVYANAFQVFENKISVNLQHLPSAAYFVQLSNNIFTHQTKIIKTITR
jgi:hypothetical protein